MYTFTYIWNDTCRCWQLGIGPSRPRWPWAHEMDAWIECPCDAGRQKQITVYLHEAICFIHYDFKKRIERNDDHETHMHFIGKIGLHFFKEPTHNGTKCSRNILLPHAGVHTVISTFNSESSWAFYLLFPESSIMEIIANLLVLETKKTHFLFTITKLHF